LKKVEKGFEKGLKRFEKGLKSFQSVVLLTEDSEDSEDE
jgi:hypothetical protein